MKKSIDKAGLKAKLHDGMSIMIGGFLANGTPERIVDVLVESGGKDLTMIVNDTSYPDRGCGRLIAKGKAKILKKCTLPLTAAGQVDLIITELCVIEVRKGQGLYVTEIRDGVTREEGDRGSHRGYATLRGRCQAHASVVLRHYP